MDDRDTPFITNQEIARVLFQVAAMLEMMHCTVYRVRAYRRAALAVLFLPRQLVEYFSNQEEPPLPGVGDRIRGRLAELVNTGRMSVHDSLLDDVGEPMLSLLTLYGVGPKTAVRLISELQITSLQDLVQAAEAHRIQELRGFGPKREQQIAQAAGALLEAAA